MRLQEFEPPVLLRDSIKCFWYIERDFVPGDVEAVSSFEVVPDGYAEIIFHFGGGCSVASSGGLQALPSPFLTGLLNRPVLFYTGGPLAIIGVRCFPWAVFDLLGLSAGKEAVRTFEHPIARLQPMLNELVTAGNIGASVALIEAYFLEARSSVAIDSMLFKAGAAMRAAYGALPVSQVAAAAHATVRTLERKFKQSSGHTVKDVSALMRFEQVRNRLWHHPETAIAGLAYELGYTDPSHLTREFKRYSGVTPTVFLRKARQAKKSAAGDFVAFIQA